jgi:hypothetical protein
VRPIARAQQLLECLREAVQDGPAPIADEYVCLRFGNQVNPTLGTLTDECCTGLAWVRVVQVDGLADPSAPDYNACLFSERRLTLEMGTARCIPYGTVEAGPTCDQWTAAALEMDADHAAMEEALCCFREVVAGQPYAPDVISVGTYEPFGPDGNCISGTLQITLDYSCACGT